MSPGQRPPEMHVSKMTLAASPGSAWEGRCRAVGLAWWEQEGEGQDPPGWPEAGGWLSVIVIYFITTNMVRPLQPQRDGAEL